MTLVRAPARNVGTWARDGKRKGASGPTMRPKVSMLTPGADCSVVAVKLGNASGAHRLQTLVMSAAFSSADDVGVAQGSWDHTQALERQVTQRGEQWLAVFRQ